MKGAIDYACALCLGEIIQREHLPTELFSETSLKKLARRKTDSTNEEITGQGSEKESIMAMLAKTGWNKAKTARLLGMSRSTFYTKLFKYGINAKPEDS